ncbi:MAG: sigma-70 family RNA polymerase sigma factor [Turneriella sp.]
MRLPGLALIAFALDQASGFMARLLPYRERLYRLALAQLRNTSDAEDAVQEALIKAGRNAQTFRSESSEYTWVVRILINHCHDVQRKVARRSKRELSDEALGHRSAQVADSRAIPEQNIELSEVSRHLMEAVNELGETYKQLILMRYFEELSYEEIAAALEINLGTVKSRMNQAKTLLKAKLIERGIREDVLG